MTCVVNGDGDGVVEPVVEGTAVMVGFVSGSVGSTVTTSGPSMKKRHTNGYSQYLDSSHI